ncbi:MAG: FAD-binding oxidoreductase [candidate division KSB1 bacterium]|nr:FAD-binding oxidoreductase [candidate division KSB1 bacterium]MDZ7294562.1 FAD-binding oxidoreductase [candidate division KSB1 bacterium]MDZ7392392.1 FAD-binding oxidoreductase [candidate division KSB1 bacterium]MDZ7414068.1 FAD-binding oxidoreductase [candidate division KSB1 bacterium]
MNNQSKHRLHGALVTGKSEIRLDSATVARYSIDGVTPSAVVWPESEEELAQWLREAHRQHAKVLVRGAGELLHLGGVPEPFDLVVCTTRLTQLLDFDAENLTVSVQAGMPIALLQHIVRQRNLRLPLDPPVSGKATIGGLVAANAFGPIRLLYGGMRDLLLGCTAVLADGTVIKSGGKTVKNVAGYDLCKLFVGSLGSIGTLTRVTLRLLPAPETTRIVLASFASRRECCRAAAALVNSPLCPAAVEVLNSAALARLSKTDCAKSSASYVLAIMFEGKRQVVAATAQEAAQELTATYGGDTRELTSKKALGFRRELSAVLRGEPGTLQVRANVPISDVEAMCVAIEERVREVGFAAEIVCHFGLGVVVANVAASQGDQQRVVERLVELRGGVAASGGSVVITRASAETKRHADVWGAHEETLDLMRRIKQQFDPRGVFVGGRFIGGL